MCSLVISRPFPAPSKPRALNSRRFVSERSSGSWSLNNMVNVLKMGCWTSGRSSKTGAMTLPLGAYDPIKVPSDNQGEWCRHRPLFIVWGLQPLLHPQKDGKRSMGWCGCAGVTFSVLLPAAVSQYGIPSSPRQVWWINCVVFLVFFSHCCDPPAMTSG